MMTVHKLSAGIDGGYSYLTRQVASADQRRAGGALADYYTARGNPPGVWMGKGAEQLGVDGGEVTEEQMRALFGQGLHPDAGAMLAAGASASATKLGAAYPVYGDLAPYSERVAGAVDAFAADHGRSPSAAERNQIAAKEARRGRRAVAGFDMVFTPVKSASVLWALGGPQVRAAVEEAHHEAVRSALGWIEEHAGYTRVGHGGAAQVDATGLICAAFDHRDSRTGDPDLHTHVAVANKVCGLDGKWRALDARNLYALGVAASERYNTRFEDALTRRLGVKFTDRAPDAATRGTGKRPVREILGVPPVLLAHFSRRRAAIEDRFAELRADYRQSHGREPSRSAQIQLAQQATLETREGKAPGRTLAEQVTDWTDQARAVIGERGLARLVPDATGHPLSPTGLDEAAVAELAGRVVRRVAQEKATWTIWNLHAEAERQLRPLRFIDAAGREQATAAVVAAATGPELSIRIAEPELIAEAPQLTRTSDGQSVFVPHGSDRFTSSEVLLAEDRLVAAAQTPATPTSALSSAPESASTKNVAAAPYLDPVVAEAAVAVHEATTGVRLDAGQRQLVTTFATSPARIAVGIGPAGAGKTTAMRAFAAAWQTAQASGDTGSSAVGKAGRVVPLATSAKAAQVLGEELGVRAENLHKFLHENNPDTRPDTGPDGSRDGWFQLRAGDVVLVDEAGMAGTLQLARLLDHAEAAGAAVRLLGDPAQLAAVDAGGALRLLEREAGATYLTDLHRFTDPEEAAATLALRAGHPQALDFYEARDRIRAGSRDAMLEAAYDAWATDVRAGQTSVLIAAASADVAALNARARAERVAEQQVEAAGVALRDGNRAGVGDWVLTRTNARHLGYGRGLGRLRGGGRWVHNGDAWQVTRRHRDGSLTVRHLHNRGRVRLPAGYVTDSVELAYAVTAHRVQGTTTQTAHALVTPEMTREALYVASTRGRHRTCWYTATETPIDADGHQPPGYAEPRTATEVLSAVLARTGAEQSARATIRDTLDHASCLQTLVARYTHARTLAATDALREAASVLPDGTGARVLADPAAPRLARTLATAAGHGADPKTVLRAAHDLADLDGVRSPAAVLATRIEDHPATLGIPHHSPEVEQPGSPLPWLPGPDVGHPGWLPYLRQRAELIRTRVAHLGSLPAAYREQYAIPQHGPQLGAHPGAGTAAGCDPRRDPVGLGPPPEPGTTRAAAYRIAYRAAAADLPDHQNPTREPTTHHCPDPRSPHVRDRPMAPRRAGPHLRR